MSQSPSNKDTADLKNLKALIIGGTGGLGRSVSRFLATSGAKVTVIGQTFRDEDLKNEISFVKCDLSSISESKRIAQTLDVSDTDLIIFTTGIFAARVKETTSEGLERDMAVSYLNRLSILKQIAPKLRSTKNSYGWVPRVFIFGYPGAGKLGAIDDLNQDKSYSFLTCHFNTVAGNEALVSVARERYSNVKFFGVNPGLVKTDIRKNLTGEGFFSRLFESAIGWFTPTPEQFAKGLVPTLISPELEDLNVIHLDAKGKPKAGSQGLTQDYARQYVEKSEELIKSKGIEI
ncbi:hypothetical protein WICMUC_003203 [Wickerhamomyces mucosus]|uniref:Oxidoreductase n=1 Tax=Wickerhamomyces mucosus TaxID=1378264 RepID=A0A9P8PM98_9ASCO|nr:hypothetical protein WICMUC_003203 [Wickerhamomyces mucosus]